MCKEKGSEVVLKLNDHVDVVPNVSQVLTAGVQEGKPFLGYVDLYGCSFETELMVRCRCLSFSTDSAMS